MATDLRFGSVPDSPATDHWKYRGRLVIPSFSARGTVVDVALRCIEDHVCDETVLWVDDDGREHTCPRYLFLPDLEKRLYHVESVTTAAPVIHITEGQLDAASLVACGLPAVGVPGAKAWKPHAHRLFQGFDRVVFWADADDKGSSMNLFRKIRQGVPVAEVMPLPQGYDVNSYFQEHGAQGIHDLVTAGSNTGSTDDDTTEEDLDGIDDGVPVHLDDEGRVIPY